MKKSKSPSTRRCDDILIEIGFEELPLDAQERLSEATREFLYARLKERFLEPRELSFYITPRRLVLCLNGLPQTQTQALKETEVGPPGPLFAEDGSPTPQAQGFAKKKNISVRTLKIVEVHGKQRIAFEKITPAQPARAILEECISDLLQKTAFAKTMRWTGGPFAFPRPIRWVLALKSSAPLCLAIAGIPSRPQTFAPRWAGEKPVCVKTIAAYFKFITRHRILLDTAERTRAIVQHLKKHTDFIHMPLAREVSALVETPCAITQDFSKEYLALPREVLVASMSKGQRIFPVIKKDAVIPRFVAIINGVFAKKDLAKIQDTYHRILDAKLKDSLFFFEHDKKTALSALTPSLKNVLFLKGLGSYHDKIVRLQKLSGEIAAFYALEGHEKRDLEKASLLCKSDLLTSLVYEFPSLEGVMGGIYALREGCSPDVSQAIMHHYKPRAQEDDLPSTKTGKILSIADKLDTICGCFFIGVRPKGSYDPYGLKRQAIGILRLLQEAPQETDLEVLIEKSLALFSKTDGRDIASAKEDLREFFFERFTNFLTEKGYTKEYIDAVAQVRKLCIADFMQRLELIWRLKKTPFFIRAAKVAERTKKIIRAEKCAITYQVDVKLFQDDIEKDLWERYLKNKDVFSELLEKQSYHKALELYAQTFFETLDTFFAKVMVNVEDTDIKNNRLSLMYSINQIMRERFADLSRLESINSVKS
jgi:glycyl-tRNA synthetase beta chain